MGLLQFLARPQFFGNMAWLKIAVDPSIYTQNILLAVFHILSMMNNNLFFKYKYVNKHLRCLHTVVSGFGT